jgi:hypothetical protein
VRRTGTVLVMRRGLRSRIPQRSDEILPALYVVDANVQVLSVVERKIASCEIAMAPCYTFQMAKLLEEAVKVLRGLPEVEQDKAARGIIDYGTYGDDLQLTRRTSRGN